MALRSREGGHHHQSNWEEVQESIKTSSLFPESRFFFFFSIDILAFAQEVVGVFFFFFSTLGFSRSV